MQVGVGPARLAIQPRQAVVHIGAGLLAVVAADAEGLVDQQDVGGLADALVDQEVGDGAVHVDDVAELALLLLDIAVDLAAVGHVRTEFLLQLRLAPEQGAEAVAVQPDHFGTDRGLDRGAAPSAVDEGHLTDVGARRKVGQEDRFSADLLLDDHAARADDKDVVAVLALADDRFAGLHLTDFRRFQHIGQVGGGQP